MARTEEEFTMKEIAVNINGSGDMDVFTVRNTTENRLYFDANGVSRTRNDLNEIITTCGEDGIVYFTNLESQNVIESLSNDIVMDGAITSVAVLNSQSKIIIVSENENCAYAYTLPPNAKMHKLLFRSTCTIRQVICSENLIGIVSDNPTFHVLLAQNTEKVIAVNGHAHNVKSMAIDPLEKYICTSSMDGTVKIFDLDIVQLEAREVASISINFSNIKDERVPLRCSWHPQGHLLAVQSKEGMIKAYQRKTWVPVLTLMVPVGSATPSDIHIVCFSPNGNYLAACTGSKEILVWDLHQTNPTASGENFLKKCVHFSKLSYESLALQWSSTKNTLIVYHAGGKLVLIEGVVPSYLPSPLLLTDVSTTPSVQSAKPILEPDDHESRVEAIKASFGFGSNVENRSESNLQDMSLTSPQSQSPFQPSAITHGPVQLLVWNLLGEIESFSVHLENEDVRDLIKITFVDRSARNVKLPDSYRFTMACLDQDGAFFAAPHRVLDEEYDQDASINHRLQGQDEAKGYICSIVYYHPFHSWANNSSWYHRFSHLEEVECIACSSEFCAVATSLNCLWIFTTSGLEYALIRLSGRIVTMTARGRMLGIFSQSPMDRLEFELLSVRVWSDSCRVQSIAKGIYPSSPHPFDVYGNKEEKEQLRRQRTQYGILEWVGFDENEILYTLDSYCCVQALCASSGWHWIPIGCLGNVMDKSPKDRFGVFSLGVNDDKLYYIPIERGQKAPRLRGKLRPVPSTFALTTAMFPLTKESSTEKSTPYQNLIWQHARMHHRLLSSSDSMSSSICEEEKLAQKQAEMDKALILMMKTACVDENVTRCYDLARCLHLEKSHRIAEKVVNHFGLHQLLKRLEELYLIKFKGSGPVSSGVTDAGAVNLMGSGTAEVPKTYQMSTITRPIVRDRNHEIPQRRNMPTIHAVAPPNPFAKRTVENERKVSNDESPAAGNRTKEHLGLERLALFQSPNCKRMKK
uniref:Uncharacterized protein AlNc14C195G8551 n=1 Tax=Albugo laibachii Nc14 TaxID=890382 RepID=F0WQ70_9STRA|nr:conserved hypothetical protein [Albugo laibachii Nc14]CCA26691.1 conserved hypothetical protein [Albugo laibachii Nc14]|eukprot:CCA26691.1 conserved hypothetical protein [Albugo laibachii Nc14]